ncbi:MAG: AMIN domain-containing protein, partial [Elusimicrobia bacterium]|nr:AMIN domain-containing protein [Elusimicrobiota bacterium]
MTTHDLKKATAALLAAALVAPQGAYAAEAAKAVAAAKAPKVEAQPAPVLFRGVDVGDDSVAIKLSGRAAYDSFLTQKPPRLVMDLIGVKDKSSLRSVPGRGAALARVRSAQYQVKPRLITRVVLDLVRMTGYKIGVNSQGLTVQLGSPVSSEAVAAGATLPAAPAAPTAPRMPVPAAPKPA